MATKEEAKAKLRKAGYSVVDDNSVLTVIIPAKASIKNTVKQVRDLLTGMDYNASFGVRQHDYSSDDAELSEGSYTEGEENAEVTEAEEEIDLSYSETSENDGEAKVAEAPKPVPKKRDGKKSATAVKSTESEREDADKKVGSEENDDDFLDEEDENFDEIDNVKLDEYDMDMLLNEESIQFSLEDFGLT
ncbi:MAG: hypothetical protein K6G69_01770 [Lachnospiraceae bacterium]|nr:hypothetical protein [Lachnospiraceae bacterium]